MSSHKVNIVLLAALHFFPFPVGISGIKNSPSWPMGTSNGSSLCWKPKDWSNAVPYDKCFISSSPWCCPDAAAATKFASFPKFSSYWGCCRYSYYTQANLPKAMWACARAWTLGCINPTVRYGNERRMEESATIEERKTKGFLNKYNLSWALKMREGDLKRQRRQRRAFWVRIKNVDYGITKHVCKSCPEFLAGEEDSRKEPMTLFVLELNVLFYFMTEKEDEHK